MTLLPKLHAGWSVNEANHSPTHVGTSPLQFPDRVQNLKEY